MATSRLMTRVTRICATPDGGSKFEDLDIPLDDKTLIGAVSKGTDVYEIVFRETDEAYDLGWHTAPCRQFIIMTNGGVDITTTDGVQRRFADGDVVLVEDTTGKGHRSKEVDKKARKSIFVKLRDDAPEFMPQTRKQDAAPATLLGSSPAAAKEMPAAETNVDYEAHANSALQAALHEAAKQFKQRHANSLKQHQTAAQVMPGGNTRTSLFTSPFPLTLSKGQGCHVWCIDGHKYVDGVGEFTAGIAGHSHPVIQAAIQKALTGGINLGGHTEAELTFADELKGRFPSMELMRFTNSGTEANLMAITAAKRFTHKSQVMVFKGGYHGSFLMFSTGCDSPVNAPFEYLMSEYNDTAAAEKLILQSKGSLACVIVEGMLGSSGCIPATPDFAQMLRRATLQVGALLILDEVMTSRLAPGGLQTALGIKPDLTTLGKYLGGGLSFGAFGGRADVMAMFDPREKNHVRHAGTFNNNALTMAAGYAGLAQVYTAQALNELNARGDKLRSALNALSARHGSKLQWTGHGSMMMPHFMHGELHSFTQATKADPRLKQLLFMDLNKKGIWTNQSCMINLSLPFGEKECELLISSVKAFLTEFMNVTG